jgi:hypothetical protein
MYAVTSWVVTSQLSADDASMRGGEASHAIMIAALTIKTVTPRNDIVALLAG